MTKKATDILNVLRSANNVLVCGHIRPDGDCVCSALAMRRLCEKLGKNADAVTGDGESPKMFAFLPDFEKLNVPRFKRYDTFIAVDCATEKRLGDNCKFISSAENSINIDHHPTNNGYCKINYIDPAASSTCAILYELFSESGLFDADIAKTLYVGLSTDTGHFMHSNTDPKVFGTAQKLSEYGFDVGKVNHDIYCNKSLNRIRLTARALDSIRLFDGGKIALMTVMQEDLISCGCTSEDTEGLIDYVSSISGVGISVSMCEQPGALFRVSFRSVDADVAAAAETFGGGGHKKAAGCIINGNRYDVAEKVVNAARAALSKLK